MSVDELRAREHLEMLNRNKQIPPPEPNEDHRVYLTIYQQWIPTPENQKAIALRRVMLRNTPQLLWNSENMANMQNIAQAQAGNSLMQENNWNNIASNNDVVV